LPHDSAGSERHRRESGFAVGFVLRESLFPSLSSVKRFVVRKYFASLGRSALAHAAATEKTCSMSGETDETI
jgi:hypothetical protein